MSFFMEKRLGKFKNSWENLDSQAPPIDARSKTSGTLLKIFILRELISDLGHRSWIIHTYTHNFTCFAS